MIEEPRSKSWWLTLPGVLTAIAGIITAVTGLIVTLHQMGVFQREEKQPPQAQHDPTKPAEATKPLTVPGRALGATIPSATSQAIQMPDGRSVTMSFMGNKVQYTILSAQREPLPPDKYLLRFRIRVWTNGGVNFWSDSFRLYAGELRLKPVNILNELVSRDETKEGEVEFEVDDSIKEAILVITVGNFSGNTKQLRLAFP